MQLYPWRYNKGGGAVWLISKANSVLPQLVDPGLDDWPIEIENCADVTLECDDVTTSHRNWPLARRLRHAGPTHGSHIDTQRCASTEYLIQVYRLCLASTSNSWSSCRLYAYGGWRCALHFLPGIFRHWDWLCRLDIELSPVALVRTLRSALSPWVCCHPLFISWIFLIPSLCWFRSGFLASSGVIPQGGSAKQATLLSTNSEMEGIVYW